MEAGRRKKVEGRLAPAGLRPERGASVAKTIAELGAESAKVHKEFCRAGYRVPHKPGA
jgi:hypothetical protein